jgi:hypothetical protein
MMLTLYYSPGSSSMAAHIALHEVGAAFEAKPLSLKRNETRTAEFLKINPAGKVPTLLVDGRPLVEVAGILFYLARRFPESGLLPHDDIEAEARVVSWMSFIASTRRANAGSNMPPKSTDLPTGCWDQIGCLASATRSPISICFASIGDYFMRSIRHPARFQTSTRIMHA